MRTIFNPVSNILPISRQTSRSVNIEESYKHAMESYKKKNKTREEIPSSRQFKISVRPIEKNKNKHFIDDDDDGYSNKKLGLHTQNLNMLSPSKLNIRPTVNPAITTSIPLNLYQTWSSLELPHKMRQTVETLKRLNPELTHYLYDDRMCREFIRENYPEDVLYTFDKLKPGAYKADLWRYCILYKYGGVYLDIKFECINGFRLIQLMNQEWFVRDLPCENKPGIYQALLVCYPNNTIMYNCIQKVVENVKNTVYGTNSLYITGPQMMTEFFDPTQIQALELYLSEDVRICNASGPILKIYDEYRHEQRRIHYNNVYGTMYERKDVYNIPQLKYAGLVHKPVIPNTTDVRTVEWNHTIYYTGVQSDVVVIGYLPNTCVSFPRFITPPALFADGTGVIKCILSWYPLKIGTIDTGTGALTELVVNVPDYFSHAISSSCGYYDGAEVWFVVHFQNRLHALVAFGVDMVMHRYSEMFVFQTDYMVLDVSIKQVLSEIRRLKWYSK